MNREMALKLKKRLEESESFRKGLIESVVVTPNEDMSISGCIRVNKKKKEGD
jgi:hypothetical protein